MLQVICFIKTESDPVLYLQHCPANMSVMMM